MYSSETRQAIFKRLPDHLRPKDYTATVRVVTYAGRLASSDLVPGWSEANARCICLERDSIVADSRYYLAYSTIVRSYRNVGALIFHFRRCTQCYKANMMLFDAAKCPCCSSLTLMVAPTEEWPSYTCVSDLSSVRCKSQSAMSQVLKAVRSLDSLQSMSATNKARSRTWCCPVLALCSKQKPSVR